MSSSSSSCTHPITYQGLCAACGLDVTSLVLAAPTSNTSSTRQNGTSGSPSSAAAAASATSAHHAIVLGGSNKTIHLSSAALKERTKSNTLELLESRKLLCVLDLDHTLLHATSDARVDSHVAQEPNLHRFTLGVPPHAKTHYVKLRPGLQTFLEELSRLYDLHVYTMGARAYADAVVPILDPTHRFIKHRVVSRDETGASTDTHIAHVAKQLKRMYPCDEGVICIVDDRTDVWQHNAKNVARVFEYLYFSGRGEMNQRPDQHTNESVSLPIFPYQLATHPYPDNVLHSLTSVLQAIHTLFYRQIDHATQPMNGHTLAAPVSDLFPLSESMSIPRLISLIKATTLEGCVIVFSGVFPTVKNKDGRPIANASGAQKAEAWIQATAYGAVCLEDFPEKSIATNENDDEPIVPFGVDSVNTKPQQVTHVVAARDGSAKLHYAASLPPEKRPLLVHVSWLWHSIAHFQKGDEKLFPLWGKDGLDSSTAVTEPHTAAKPQVAATSSSSSSTAAAAPAAATPAPVLPSPTAAKKDVIDLSVDAAPASSISSMVTVAVGGIRRRIPKKVAPVIMAESNTSASASSTVAASSFSAPAASDTVPATASSSAPDASTAVSSSGAASSSSAATPISSRYALHLVHHVQHPVTSYAIVSRVQAHINAIENAKHAKEAEADLIQAQEMVKAQDLLTKRRSSGSIVIAASTSDISSSSLSTPAKHPKGRKSVSFNKDPLGPTNPNYAHETHTAPDFSSPPLVHSSPSSSLKRKANTPLDDIDLKWSDSVEQKDASGAAAHNVPKRRLTNKSTMTSITHAQPFSSSLNRTRNHSSNLGDTDDVDMFDHRDGIDTDQYHDASGGGNGGGDNDNEGFDPFAIDDECFGDEQEYGDDGNQFADDE